MKTCPTYSHRRPRGLSKPTATNLSSCISPWPNLMCRAFRTRDLPAKPPWGRLRADKWKLAQPLDPKITTGHKMQAVPAPELYNLADDPGEKRDLAAADPQKLAWLQARLAQIRH